MILLTTGVVPWNHNETSARLSVRWAFLFSSSCARQRVSKGILKFSLRNFFFHPKNTSAEGSQKCGDPPSQKKKKKAEKIPAESGKFVWVLGYSLQKLHLVLKKSWSGVNGNFDDHGVLTTKVRGHKKSLTFWTTLWMIIQGSQLYMSKWPEYNLGIINCWSSKIPNVLCSWWHLWKVAVVKNTPDTGILIQMTRCLSWAESRSCQIWSDRNR